MLSTNCCSLQVSDLSISMNCSRLSSLSRMLAGSMEVRSGSALWTDVGGKDGGLGAENGGREGKDDIAG